MGSAKTVLLVDDDADFVEMNRELLRERGYVVRVAYTGRQCMEEVAARRPDLIILDMVMENRSDGFNISRELRNSPYTRSIPLVMITAVNDSIPFRVEPDRTWLPVDALLEKPVDPRLLLAVVDKALQPAPLIFLVDDDHDFLELEQSILAGQGYRVACFTDPRVALAAIAEAEHSGRPALVVADLMMKAMDSGFTLARTLKSNPCLADIPVLIVSAVASQKGFDFRPRTAEDLAAMHAEAFFDKPVQPEAFLAKVKELLG